MTTHIPHETKTFCGKTIGDLTCLIPQNWEDYDRVTCASCKAGYEAWVKDECVHCPHCGETFRPGTKLIKCVTCEGIGCPCCQHTKHWHRLFDCAGAGGNATV